jgi:hypothetical protein
MKPRFTITIEAADCACEYRALRALLKVLLRRFGLKCLDIRAEHKSQLVSDSASTLHGTVNDDF